MIEFHEGDFEELDHSGETGGNCIIWAFARSMPPDYLTIALNVGSNSAGYFLLEPAVAVSQLSRWAASTIRYRNII